jgi:hypothetical protein
MSPILYRRHMYQGKSVTFLAVIVHISQSAWVLVPAVLSAIFTATAAAASWRSVVLSRRAQADADRPQLVFAIVGSGEGSAVDVRIENVGRGVAIFVGFLILSGDGAGSSTIISPHVLYPNQPHRSRLPFVTTDTAVGIVFCEDRYGNTHSWSARREYRFYKQGTTTTARTLLKNLYPESNLDSSVTLLPATPVE